MIGLNELLLVATKDGKPKMYGDYRIIENKYAPTTKNGEPYNVNRSWKERLFSNPWKPLKKFKEVVDQIPCHDVIYMETPNKVMYVDTSTYKLLIQTIELQRKGLMI